MKILVLFIVLGFGMQASYAHNQWSGSRPDGHAPIGVMGDHLHKTGEWMFSYRYKRMQMDGMRDGTDDLTDADVLKDFPVTPTRMSMEMHMPGLMYAPTDDLTLMLMVPLIKKNMDHVTRMGARFTTRSEGLGDIKLSGLYALKRWNNQQLHLNAGVSFPTGDIDEKDVTPAGSNTLLPYPMQLGSGSWDLLPGITYLGQNNMLSWGMQAIGTIRLNDNDNDYRLGNRFELTGWGAKKFNNTLSGSLRLKGLVWGDIQGNDPKLNPNVVPTADANLQGGKRIDILAGLNFYSRSGITKGHRLAVEVGTPIYEDLDGPQMSTQWMVTVGWQYAM